MTEHDLDEVCEAGGKSGPEQDLYSLETPSACGETPSRRRNIPIWL